MKFSLTILLIIFVGIPSQLKAQLSSSEFYGTKSNALGSFTSVFKDINAAYTNQAGLAYLKGTAFNLSYENKFLTLDLSSINFAAARNFNNIGTFSLAINKFGISEYNEVQVGTSYAKKLNNQTAISLQVNFFNLSIKGYGSRSTVSFETGIIRDINKNLSFGFHIINPFPIKFIDDINLPTIITLGSKYKISNNLNFYGELEKHINHDFFLKSGLEYNPLRMIYFYLGFKNNFNGYADYSLGFKYQIRQNINIEFSTLYNLTLGTSPSLGITYQSIGTNLND